MQRLLSAFLILLSLFGLFGQFSPVHAEALPASPWYAVAWNHQADQLFWINAQGSQAMIDRPQIPDEKPNGTKSLYFSRNGKSMVVVAEQNDGRYGLGFYDLEVGQFYVVHQTAPGEILGSVFQPSTPNSDRIALAVYNPQTLAYRFLDFELPTGNAIHQLSSADAGSPQMPQGTVPFVALYDIDQATNKYMVHFQFKSVIPAEINVAYIWFSNDANNPIGPGAYKDNEFDIKWPDNRVAYGLVHPSYNFVQNGGAVVPANMIGLYYSGASPEVGHLDQGHILRYPKWLNNGQWLGYRVEADQALQPHWEVKSLDENVTPNAVALGPNFLNIWGTSDGYLALDPTAGKLYHNTQYQIEAFSTEVGNSVFVYPASQTVTIPYVTPLGSQFQLTNVGDPQVVFDTPDDLAAPNECANTPPTRLTVGGNARVAFTDGSVLNVRTEANGDILATQLAEGTQVSVLNGPVCAGGYNWYMIQPANGEVGGWSAEGVVGEYWLEPALIITAVSPVPGNIGQTVDGSCISAPPNYLNIGITAQVGQLGGTLAMRNYPTDPTPFQQLSQGTVVSIVDGPLCHGGWRFYKVSTTGQNGQASSGWVTDGLGSSQFLIIQFQVIIN